ncbi:MAG: rod shape-determining protein RodA [Thermosynechococcaceae cyanobacterium]
MLTQRSRRSSPWKRWLQPWENLDIYLFWTPILLTGLGGLLIRSTELHQGWTDWSQHWIVGAVGIGLMLLFARLNYKTLLSLHWLIYGLTSLALLAVKFVGTSALGAQRWINIAGFNVQPSEFAKLGLIISVAALLHHRPADTIPAVLRTLLITALPWGLVFIQPDLGTSLVFGAITLGMLYWGNAHGGWIILMLSPLISAILLNIPMPPALTIVLWIGWTLIMGGVAWWTLPNPLVSAIISMVVNLGAATFGHFVWGLLQDYQRDRLILFLDPDKDPLGGGYHLIQSRIAIGAGQLWGKGLNQGTQTQLNFIPEQHTDFIFSAVGEEFGFLGCLFLMVAFWLICVRLIKVANDSEDNFGSLLCIGIFAMLIFQVVINVGMTIGLAPVTGIPLPWLSYGRSALLTNYMALGLAQSVANHPPPRRGLYPTRR